MPLEKWVEFEKEINKRFGIDVNVFNPQGYRITEFKAWANKLCPAIKDTDKGQSFICATAHMNVSGMAKKTKEPVIEECDAGLIKIVVPIFINDEFVSAVGACGHIFDEGEIDDFLINKITEIEEKTIEDLSKDIPYITTEKTNDLANFIKKELEFRCNN
jgi:ligand-binding sensor protein